MTKLLTTSLLALAMSTSLAVAQTSGGAAATPGVTGPSGNTDDPVTGFDPAKGFEAGTDAFVDDKGALRDEAGARNAFTAMAADQQKRIRDTCAAYRASGQTNVEVPYTTPAAGAYNMTVTCDWVDRW